MTPRRQIARTGSAVLLIGALTLTLTSLSAPAASGGIDPECGSWTIAPTTGTGTNDSVLYSVAAVSPSEAWAVGWWSSANVSHTLVERWDGARWMTVPSVDPPDASSSLNAVAAVSSGDVWAVGFAYERSTIRTLVEHLSGGVWHVVKSPDPGDYESVLTGVAAVSASDVWAVGFERDADQPRRKLVEHWNGTRWKVVEIPSPTPEESELDGVAALARDDVWATGVHGSGVTLIEHWNGRVWGAVPGPDIGQSTLYDVASAGGADNVRAVGYLVKGQVSVPLAIRWDGSLWSVTDTQAPPPGFALLMALAVATPDDVWAVGFWRGAGGQPRRTLGEHWDGVSWTIQPTANAGLDDGLTDVVHVPGTSIWWAVGYYVLKAGGSRFLIESNC